MTKTTETTEADLEIQAWQDAQLGREQVVYLPWYSKETQQYYLVQIAHAGKTVCGVLKMYAPTTMASHEVIIPVHANKMDGIEKMIVDHNQSVFTDEHDPLLLELPEGAPDFDLHYSWTQSYSCLSIEEVIHHFLDPSKGMTPQHALQFAQLLHEQTGITVSPVNVSTFK